MYKVSAFLDKCIENKDVPGAVLGIVHNDQLIYQYASGYAHFQKEISMKVNSIFDLASLTKVCATLPAVLYLLEEGLLDLDDAIYQYLPFFHSKQSNITIKHLLTHTSGYPASIPFYKQNKSLKDAIEIISNLENIQKPGDMVVYSDLNFIVLGYLVEVVSGLQLDTFSNEKIFKPLEMNNTYFNPPASLRLEIVPTEYNNYIKDYQWGRVHDENAEHFGGVSGHAGLFSTLEDLSIYCRMILNKGKVNDKTLFQSSTIDLTRYSYTKKLNLNRGLGWHLNDCNAPSGQFLQEGFGHTGFTGTSIWFDMHKNLAIILLTNRVHFGRNKNIGRIRRIVHNLVSLNLDI